MNKELTFKDMPDCLVERQDKKYFFQFPGIDKTLVIDFENILDDQSFDPDSEETLRLVLESAWFEYRAINGFEVGV